MPDGCPDVEGCGQHGRPEYQTNAHFPIRIRRRRATTPLHSKPHHLKRSNPKNSIYYVVLRTVCVWGVLTFISPHHIPFISVVVVVVAPFTAFSSHFLGNRCEKIRIAIFFLASKFLGTPIFALAESTSEGE
jgi:prepilin signal peptidase PulO-like enzyme (type II secretory pathway)